MIRIIGFSILLLFVTHSGMVFAEENENKIKDFCEVSDDFLSCLMFKSLFRPTIVVSKDGFEVAKRELGGINTPYYASYAKGLGDDKILIFVNGKKYEFTNNNSGESRKFLDKLEEHMISEDYKMLTAMIYLEFEQIKASEEIIKNLNDIIVASETRGKLENTNRYDEELEDQRVNLEQEKNDLRELLKGVRSRTSLLRSICKYEYSDSYCKKNILDSNL